MSTARALIPWAWTIERTIPSATVRLTVHTAGDTEPHGEELARRQLRDLCMVAIATGAAATLCTLPSDWSALFASHHRPPGVAWTDVEEEEVTVGHRLDVLALGGSVSIDGTPSSAALSSLLHALLRDLERGKLQPTHARAWSTP